MSQKRDNHKPDKEKSDNAFVRFRPGQAEWLRGKVDGNQRSVPEVVKRIVDREMTREELANEKPRRRQR